MTNGEVTATTLNLRSAPDGDIIGTLPRGTKLLIAGERGDWLDVEVGDKRGVVSARFVKHDVPDVPDRIPAAAQAGDGSKPSTRGTTRF